MARAAKMARPARAALVQSNEVPKVSTVPKDPAKESIRAQA